PHAQPPHPHSPHSQQQAPYAAYPQAAGRPGAAPWPGRAPMQCKICGCQPAAYVTIRAHRGMIALMQFLSKSGPFCRSCGIAVYRQMTAQSLWQGWWSPFSLVVHPIILLMNVIARQQLYRLPPPSGGWHPPLDPGKPVPQRPGAIAFGVILLAIVCLITVSALTGHA
ncbi:hypothetical protein, partial [Nocardiopsis gilva]